MKFIYGIPKEGEYSDEFFYDFCRGFVEGTTTTEMMNGFIKWFMESDDSRPFVSLNALLFNYIPDEDLENVGVRILNKDIPLSKFHLVKIKLYNGLGIGEVLADTEWGKDSY